MVLYKRLMHINAIGQMALTLADGLDDLGAGSVYQRDTLTTMRNSPISVHFLYWAVIGYIFNILCNFHLHSSYMHKVGNIAIFVQLLMKMNYKKLRTESFSKRNLHLSWYFKLKLKCLINLSKLFNTFKQYKYADIVNCTLRKNSINCYGFRASNNVYNSHQDS